MNSWNQKLGGVAALILFVQQSTSLESSKIKFEIRAKLTDIFVKSLQNFQKQLKYLKFWLHQRELSKVFSIKSPSGEYNWIIPFTCVIKIWIVSKKQLKSSFRTPFQLEIIENCLRYSNGC